MKLPTTEFITLDSGKPGTITTLMAGVHGNEKSGIILLEEFATTLKVVQGKVHLILQANPRAIAKNERQTDKNMNRAFHKTPQGTEYEDIRAQEIIPILNESDILLDIHNTLNSENSVPFLISEYPEWNKYFPTEISVGGLDVLHPGGSDGYMNSIGKIGLCIESGSIRFADEGVARRSVENFLKATGNIEGEPILYTHQKYYHLDTIIKAKTERFEFIKKWKDFEHVQQGEIIAHDGDEEIKAPYNGIIVFRHETKKIGDEMCVFGVEKI